MIRYCSPLLFYIFGAIILLPLGLAFYGYTRARRQDLGEIDHTAWMLAGLLIAAVTSLSVFIIYFFSHTIGC